MRKLMLLAVVALVGALFSSAKVDALSGSDFQAGHIIDDNAFYNGQSLGAAEIQEFLNAKVPVCDTNGTQMHSSGQTRAAYAASQGYSAPFTCLRNYRQDTPSRPAEAGLCDAYTGANRSAAEIIYEVGKSCGISQRALLVLLQKEQSLVTDDWPWSIQYRSATGYGCPDTAPCDSEYYGFFNQVYNAARQFKKYARDSSQFRYRPYRVNYVQYNPVASCGGTDVNITSQATASLYNYTPYQPNPSALANLYGSGDACGAYGNRNFWRMHNDWFGPTTQSDNYWALVKHPSDGRVYIATEFAVHYVPNSQTLVDWGLSQIEPTIVPASFISSRVTGSPVSRLLNDKYGNIFFIDSGKRHYVRDGKYLSLYGIDPNSSIGINGLVSYLPDSEWLGYCPRFTSNQSLMYAMSNGRRLYLPNPAIQAAWGCNSSQVITLSDSFLSSYTDGGTTGRYMASSGGRKYVVDQGTLWSNDNNAITQQYIGDEAIGSLGSVLEQIMPKSGLTLFARNTADGAWYLIENERKHYILSGKIAELWGYGGTQGGINTFSASLLGSLSNGAILSSAAQTASPNKYYLLAGDKKHYLPNSQAVAEWLPSGTSVETMSDSLLALYSDGVTLDSPVAKNQRGDYYIAQDGKRIALTHANYVDAWTSPSASVLSLSDKLYNYLDGNGGASFVLKDGSTYYYLEAGIRYQIPSSLVARWSPSTATTLLSGTLGRYPISGSTVKPFAKIGSKTYALNNLTSTELQPNLASIIPSSETVTLQRNYFSGTASSTHLLKSTDSSDQRMWLVTPNGKLQFTNGAIALNMGYISRSVGFTMLSPEALAAIPTNSGTTSLLIQSPSGALKLISFGQALGFDNGEAAVAYASVTNSVMQVSKEVFDFFPLQRSASKIIRDDSGKVYLLQNGQKRWIINGNVLRTTYQGIPETYLQGTVMTLIPNGPEIR